uniref:Putative ovule protein n=1 Tax=Solanum chacoense TaxID=4108 RepID=A0A0V0J0J3_SOLCH
MLVYAAMAWLTLFLLDLNTDLSLNLAISLLILTEGVLLTASGYYKQKLRRKRMRLTVSLRIFHWKGGCLSLLSASDFPITVTIPTAFLSILNRGSI